MFVRLLGRYRSFAKLGYTVAIVAMICGDRLGIAREDDGRPSRWAIVGDASPEAMSLVDLLTVELSKDAGLRLVEREDIRRVMDEQQLSVSALVAQAQALKLGQLLSANAFLVIEQRGTTSHVRLIESRSGILLWDYLGADAFNSIGRLREELLTNAQKLATPFEERRYVALMGFVAEESDELLQAWTYALPALLEHDLRLQPGCCVLERRQLQRLTSERDLTDIELQLRGASILVEGSLRRSDEANQIEITLKLMRPDGSSRDAITVRSAPADLNQTTREAATLILHALDGSTHRSVAIEAGHFAERADWLISHKLIEQAKANAYAAAAIEPSRKNLSRVYWIHTRLCEELLKPLTHQDFTSVSTRDRTFETVAMALREARYAHEYDAKQLRLAIEEGDLLRKVVYREPARDYPNQTGLKEVFTPHVPVSLTEEPPAVAMERAALQRAMLAKYDLVSAAAKKRLGTDLPHRDNYLWLVRERLALAAYFETSPDRYLQQVRRLNSEIERAMVALDDGRTVQNRWRPLHVEALRRALSFGMLIGGSSPSFKPVRGVRSQLSRDWEPDIIQPMVVELASHPDPAMRLLALERRAWASGDVAAGVEALELSREHFRETWECYNLLFHLGSHLQESNQLALVVEPYLERLERTHDPALLSSGIFDLIRSAPEKQVITWRKRLLRACPEEIDDWWTVRMFDILKIEMLQSLSGDEYNEYASLGPRKTRAVVKPEGAWNNFTYATVDPKSPGAPMHCFNGCFGIDPRTQAPELLLLLHPKRIVGIGLDGAISTDCREIVTAPATPAGYYWNKRYGAMLAAVDSDVPAELPSGQFAARWHDGRLYLGDSAFRVYDPATKRIENLSASLRLDARNALDSTRGYLIRKILPDPSEKHLYLEVDSLDRVGGIWRYTPADQSLKQMVAGRATMLHWDEGKLLFEQLRSPVRWHLLDPDSLQTTSLPGYMNTPTSDLIKVGPYLITIFGTLHTKDGGIHRFPQTQNGWEVIMPIHNGFVAAKFDKPPVRLWKFQLKSQYRDRN